MLECETLFPPITALPVIWQTLDMVCDLECFLKRSAKFGKIFEFTKKKVFLLWRLWVYREIRLRSREHIAKMIIKIIAP